MNQILTYFKKIFPYIILVVLGYLLWKFIDFKVLYAQFQKSNLFFILLAGFFVCLSNYFRAMRMNMLLKTLGHKISDYSSTLAVFVSYFVNLLVPRLGEITRCTLLQKTDNVPMQVSVGAVVTERIIDMLCLLLFLVFGLIIEYDVVIKFLSEIVSSKKQIFDNMFFIIIIFVVAFVGLAIYLINNNLDKILKISIFNKIFEIIKGFWQGLVGVLKIENKSLFFAYALCTWICYFIITWMLMLAFEPTKNLGWQIAFICNALGAVGMAAPVQGGIGAYHFMVQSILMVYGIPAEMGLICATLLHTTLMFETLFFGIIASGLAYLIVKNKKT